MRDRLRLRSTLGHTVAKFQQVNKGRSDIHHDALEFPDGKIVLLTHLCKGQRATVLQLPARPRITVDDANGTICSPCSRLVSHAWLPEWAGRDQVSPSSSQEAFHAGV